jgi:DNA modification methylase
MDGGINEYGNRNDGGHAPAGRGGDAQEGAVQGEGDDCEPDETIRQTREGESQAWAIEDEERGARFNNEAWGQVAQRDTPDDQIGSGISHHERTHAAVDPEEVGRDHREAEEIGQAGSEPERVRGAVDPAIDLTLFADGLRDVAKVLAGRSRWCIVTAECVRVMRALPDLSVDHVITDPPYSAVVHARSIRRTTLPDVRDQPCRATRAHDFGFESLSDELLSECCAQFARLANRWRIVFADMETAEKWRGGIGGEYIRTGIWVKDRAMPQISGDRPGSRAELFTIAHRAGKKRWNAGGDGNVYQCPVVTNANGHRRDRVHTAQKPIGLMHDLLRDFTDPDDVVFDPFCGSGTTGVAALQLGRRAILIEQNPEFAAIATERMIAADSGSTLDGVRAKQIPMFGGAR